MATLQLLLETVYLHIQNIYNNYTHYLIILALSLIFIFVIKAIFHIFTKNKVFSNNYKKSINWVYMLLLMIIFFGIICIYGIIYKYELNLIYILIDVAIIYVSIWIILSVLYLCIYPIILLIHGVKALGNTHYNTHKNKRTEQDNQPILDKLAEDFTRRWITENCLKHSNLSRYQVLVLNKEDYLVRLTTVIHTHCTNYNDVVIYYYNKYCALWKN